MCVFDRLDASEAQSVLCLSVLERAAQRAHTHTHTQTHTHVGFYGLRGLSIGVMVFILYKLYVLLPYTYPTPKLSPHRRRCISIFPQKSHSVWFISIFNYGDTENVLINHLLLVIPMSYPCHYTNLCPHKPHKHAHTQTDTHAHTLQPEEQRLSCGLYFQRFIIKHVQQFSNCKDGILQQSTDDWSDSDVKFWSVRNECAALWREGSCARRNTAIIFRS